MLKLGGTDIFLTRSSETGSKFLSRHVSCVFNTCSWPHIVLNHVPVLLFKFFELCLCLKRLVLL